MGSLVNLFLSVLLLSLMSWCPPASLALVDSASGARRRRVVMFSFPFRSHIALMLQLAELLHDRARPRRQRS
uniref:Secreted protein n=1 Tax=Oryza sativa subsp. japonica TaxID=39947 RepID=Q69U84_ORYSJ|nr:hypothetical protein [Oryza sativa Japonica Group]